MFQQSIEILKELHVKRELDSKTLSIREKLEIAEECMKKVKSREEYLEIQQTYEELKNLLKLEKKGFLIKEKYLSEEEVGEILYIADGEIKQAEKEYLKLKKRAEDIDAKYKKEMKTLTAAMEEIEKGHTKAKKIDEHLPAGVWLYESKINHRWENTAHAARLKYEGPDATKIMAVGHTRPLKGAELF